MVSSAVFINQEDLISWCCQFLKNVWGIQPEIAFMRCKWSFGHWKWAIFLSARRALRQKMLWSCASVIVAVFKTTAAKWTRKSRRKIDVGWRTSTWREKKFDYLCGAPLTHLLVLRSAHARCRPQKKQVARKGVLKDSRGNKNLTEQPLKRNWGFEFVKLSNLYW